MRTKCTLWADPGSAAQAVAALCPQARQKALERAGEICQGRFVFLDHWEMERAPEPVCFSGGVNWEQSPNGDPEWVYALNRHTIFVNLGKAWRMTGKEEYRDAFLALLDDWLTRVPHTPEGETTAWRALEAGLRAENWLRALRLFEGAVPEALLARAEESLREHGKYLCTAHGNFQRLSNWGVIQDHGLFLLGVWFGRRDWQDLALSRLTANLHNAVLPDGTHWEQSPMYHCEVLHGAADTLLAARQNEIPVSPELEEKTLAMCRALAAWVMPGRNILPQSDSDVIDAGDLLAQGALLFGDPALAAAAAGPVLEETLWDFGPDASRMLAEIPQTSSDSASDALPCSGNYMMRASRDERAACLHLHGGPLGGGHGHADLLHLDVYHQGEGVLVDGGRGTYVEGPLRRELKCPAAHNTLRIDGADFTRYLDTWGWADHAQPLPACWASHPRADYLCAGHLGYLNRGCVVQRKVLFIKPGWVILADMIRASDDRPHTLQQNFHFGPGSLTLLPDGAHWQGKATCARMFWPEERRAALGMSVRAPAYNTLQDTPALELESDFQGDAVRLTVLVLGDGEAAVTLLPVRDAWGRELPPTAAQALRLEEKDRCSTVILSHKPGDHSAGLLFAGECAGYGEALLFQDDLPGGLCLA